MFTFCVISSLRLIREITYVLIQVLGEVIHKTLIARFGVVVVAYHELVKAPVPEDCIHLLRPQVLSVQARHSSQPVRNVSAEAVVFCVFLAEVLNVLCIIVVVGKGLAVISNHRVKAL